MKEKNIHINRRKKLMKAMLMHKTVDICVILGITFVLQLMARSNPQFVQWYGTTIYPYWSQLIGRITSLFPFSVVEIGIYVLIAIVVVKAVFFFIDVINRRRRFWVGLLAGVLTFVQAVSILLLLYTVGCGVNYQRKTFSEINEIERGKYTEADLIKLCVGLTTELNRDSKTVSRDKTGAVMLGDDVEERAADYMKELNKSFLGLADYYPQAKAVYVSEILSYQNLTGVFSPFTIEANYNQDVTAYNIPFTVCHELVHTAGIMGEDEANFIAFLACEKSEDEEFRYSGVMLAWIHCMNALMDVNPEAYNQVKEQANEMVLSDLKENTVFWDQYDSAVAKISHEVNDTYLKMNNQSNGVQSYGYVVDLLIAYYKGQMN